MRIIVVVIAALSFCLAAGSALAASPPVNGSYPSTDLGGLLLTGRFSESWVVGAPGQIGNTVNAGSWDGAALGGQWRVWCASIAQMPVLVSDTRVGGTGEVTYRTAYTGGLLWLSRFGPWSADNLVDFTGVLDSFVSVATYQYVAGQLLGVRANIVTSGMIDPQEPFWSDNCLEFSISNATFTGMSPATLPADFPGFLDPGNCPSDVPALTVGGWGTTTQINLLLTGCSVPVQERSWGAIKSIYR